MASRTGRASAAPPRPLRNARRSMMGALLIDVSAWVVCILLFFEEQFGTGHEADHILHAITARLETQSVLLQGVQFTVGQAAASGVRREMFEDAEGYLIDAILGQIMLQIVDAGNFCLIRQFRFCIDMLGLEA